MFRTSVNLPGGDDRGYDGDDDVDHIDHVVHVDDVDVDHVDDNGQLAAEEDARILCRLEVLVVHGGRDERIFDLCVEFSELTHSSFVWCTFLNSPSNLSSSTYST